MMQLVQCQVKWWKWPAEKSAVITDSKKTQLAKMGQALGTIRRYPSLW